ncbi:hypothetical protein YC2023_064206 [Brassica napus]
MRDQHLQRPRGSRTVYPLAIILSPTRELASQIHEAKTFTCQTGVKVIVAYGGTPINQQLIAAYGLLVWGLLALFFLISVSFLKLCFDFEVSSA